MIVHVGLPVLKAGLAMIAFLVLCLIYFCLFKYLFGIIQMMF